MMKKSCWMMIGALFLTSCASSGVKTLHVNTEPKGAEVSMGEQTCQSPWVLGAAIVVLAGLIATSPSPKDTTMTAVVAGFLESLLVPTDIDIDVTMKAKE